METLESKLTVARDSLSPTNWRKGSYFKSEGNTICMCSHGAVQAQVNPDCKSIPNPSLPVLSPWLRPWSRWIATHPNMSVMSAIKEAIESALFNSLCCGRGSNADLSGQFTAAETRKEIWDKRSDTVKSDYILDSVNYGNTEAHYLLGMVGLTFNFNDDPFTTFEMVQEKFNQAIALAKELGV